MPLAQTIDDPLHVLVLILSRHQNRVRRRDDHQVLDADGGHQRALAADVAILGRLRQHFADRRVPAGIAIGHLREVDHEPTSVQSKSTGRTAMRSVRSITA